MSRPPRRAPMTSGPHMEKSAAHRPRRRRWTKTILALVLGFALTAVLLEIVLRFLPVNEGSNIERVSAEQPVLHFQPERCFTWSRGPQLSLVTEICTNNVGFRNDRDYVLDPSQPLLALVGDSFVVAAMVPFQETLGARLDRELGEAARVYSFAVGGAAFPQYLVWAEYARERFKPDAFVFVLVANDFPGALKPTKGMHHFERKPDGSSALVRTDYRAGWKRRLVHRSALGMYLTVNVRLADLIESLGKQPKGSESRRFVGNTAARVSVEALNRQRWAFECFLDRLPDATGVSFDRIVFVVDGMRPHMYDPADLAFAETSAWGSLRPTIVEQGGERGIEVVDMHPLFMSRHRSDGARFEPVGDNHWNGLAHDIAALATVDTRVVREFLDSSQ